MDAAGGDWRNAGGRTPGARVSRAAGVVRDSAGRAFVDWISDEFGNYEGAGGGQEAGVCMELGKGVFRRDRADAAGRSAVGGGDREYVFLVFRSDPAAEHRAV